MKINDVTEFEAQHINIEIDGNVVEFTRWGKDNWSRWYGCSLEDEYNCEEYEKLYQDWRLSK